jgi:hypothetical protein
MDHVRSRCEQLSAERGWIRRFAVEQGFDEHAYVNLTFETDHPKLLWQLLSDELYHSNSLGLLMRTASIAACEGQRGWDDFVLLHHFDPDVSCDRFPE